MASETVQAGEQVVQEEVQQAAPVAVAALEVAPVNVAQLRESIADLLTRADVLLSARGSMATESGFDALADLADGMGGLSHNLAYAIVGHHVLSAIHTHLRDRAQAVLEVCEMPKGLLGQYFGEVNSDMLALLLDGCEVPERWRKRFCLGPDIPF